MSEGGFEQQGNLGTPVDNSQEASFQTSADEGQPGINPKWNKMLGVLPGQFRDAVVPHLRDWDQGVQKQFQQIHSQYEPYKPFLDSGISPQDIQQGLGFIQALQDQDQAENIVRTLIEHYGFNLDGAVPAEQDETGQPQTPQLDPSDPRLQQLEQGFQTMADIMLAQQAEQDAKIQDGELDVEFADAKKKFGIADNDMGAERFMQGVIIADPSMSAEQAAQQYTEVLNQALTSRNRPMAPVVMGGGGVPSGSLDASKLSDKDRRALATRMIQAAQTQG